MYCKNCGADIQDGANFCQNCGQKLSSQTPDLQQTYNNNTIVKKNNKKKKTIIISIVSVVVVIIIALISLVAVLLSGDNQNRGFISNNSNSIIGTWVNDNSEICFTFTENGDCKVTNKQNVVGTDSVRYQVSEVGTITFYDQFFYPYDPLDYEINNDKLYIVRGSTQYEFVRENSKNADFYGLDKFGDPITDFDFD